MTCLTHHGSLRLFCGGKLLWFSQHVKLAFEQHSFRIRFAGCGARAIFPKKLMCLCHWIPEAVEVDDVPASHGIFRAVWTWRPSWRGNGRVSVLFRLQEPSFVEEFA